MRLARELAAPGGQKHLGTAPLESSEAEKRSLLRTFALGPCKTGRIVAVHRRLHHALHLLEDLLLAASRPQHSAVEAEEVRRLRDLVGGVRGCVRGFSEGLVQGEIARGPRIYRTTVFLRFNPVCIT